MMIFIIEGCNENTSIQQATILAKNEREAWKIFVEECSFEINSILQEEIEDGVYKIKEVVQKKSELLQYGVFI